MKRQRPILGAGLIATLCILLSSCDSPGLLNGDYAIRLSAGYQIVHGVSDEVVVVDPDSIQVVAPTVDGYRDYGRVLAGHVRKCRNRNAHAASLPGYFILDYKNGRLQQGLSKKQWLTRLRGYGIRQTPKLLVPPG